MFDPFISVTGAAAPLSAPNVDTDVIIRIERLTANDPEILGHWAFEAWRYNDDGSENPDFPLNNPKWRKAKILLAGPNFGCGSSREGAVTAVQKVGIRCVIAESFGDIFFSNCFQNGLLAIRLPEEQVAEMRAEAAAGEDFNVDLERCTVTAPSGRVWPFETDLAKREALMAGLDDMGLTLQHIEDIKAWQEKDTSARPWVWDLSRSDIQKDNIT